jgi:uncharacterized membrane protein
MKPLFVLLSVFGITAAVSKIFYHQWNSVFAGNLAMSIMLFFTAMAHFAFSKGMAMMLPPFLPFKKVIVYVTGLIEILAGVGLLIQPCRHTTSVLLIIFFILILPAPLQIFFIEWAWYFGI